MPLREAAHRAVEWAQARAQTERGRKLVNELLKHDIERIEAAK